LLWPNTASTAWVAGDGDANDVEPPIRQPKQTTCGLEIRDLLQRGLSGDQSCMPQLRQALDDYPELVDQLGDVVNHIRCSLIALVTTNPLGQETLSRVAARMRAELQATAVTPIEKLLADRVAVCWLDVHTCDLELANRRKTLAGDSSTVRAAERRLDRAQARFLAASKALATAQKHLRPAPSVLELLGSPPRDARATSAAERRGSFKPACAGVTAN
jgi:hypothetical protein